MSEVFKDVEGAAKALQTKSISTLESTLTGPVKAIKDTVTNTKDLAKAVAKTGWTPVDRIIVKPAKSAVDLTKEVAQHGIMSPVYIARIVGRAIKAVFKPPINKADAWLSAPSTIEPAVGKVTDGISSKINAALDWPSKKLGVANDDTEHKMAA